MNGASPIAPGADAPGAMAFPAASAPGSPGSGDARRGAPDPGADPAGERARAEAAGAAAVSPGRRRYGFFLVAATLLLIFAGAEVKSRQAGLSVPDWPLSYGMVWPPMVGNIFFEHGHRTIAAGVGLATVLMAIWTARVERRSWVRRLALWLVVAVCAQGLLGGLTVLFMLPPPISIAHGLLAQSFLCLVALLALALSREWAELAGRRAAATGRVPGPESVPVRLARRTAAVAAGLVYVQLLLGLLVRHTESGLAVPFFPLSPTGSPVPEHVDWHVVVHLAHRGFAAVVLAGVLLAATRTARALPRLKRHATLAGALACLQVLLGATVIWTAQRSEADGVTPVVMPVPTSLHVLTGAALLATTLLLALRVRNLARTPAAAGTAPGTVPGTAPAGLLAEAAGPDPRSPGARR